MDLHDPLPKNLLRLVTLLVCEEILSRRKKQLQILLSLELLSILELLLELIKLSISFLSMFFLLP